MIQAIVAVLPVPVAPSMVWNRSPAWRLSESSAIACGWSPVGRYASDVWSEGTRDSVSTGLGGTDPAPGRAEDRLWPETPTAVRSPWRDALRRDLRGPRRRRRRRRDRFGRRRPVRP